MKPTIADITLECFGEEKGSWLLERGAIHPINDRRERKACFIKGYQHGFFDIETRDYVAVGFQAGPLSGIQVLDIDLKSLVPKDPVPNVFTRRGAHYWGALRPGSHPSKPHPKVDFITNSNVVFYDQRDKTFVHPNLITDIDFDRLVRSLQPTPDHVIRDIVLGQM